MYLLRVEIVWRGIFVAVYEVLTDCHSLPVHKYNNISERVSLEASRNLQTWRPSLKILKSPNLFFVQLW